MSPSESSRAAHRSVSSLSSPSFQTRYPHMSQDFNDSHRSPKSVMTSSSEPSSSSPRPGPASRLMLSVKRTLSSSNGSRKRPPDYQVCLICLCTLVYRSSYYPPQTPGLLSTLEESSTPPPLHQFRDPDPVAPRPTIEQIAMGLHVSRTPHLRPLGSSPYAFSQRNTVPLSSRSHDHHIILPPPPTRSSLKKPSTTLTSSSSSPAVSTPFLSASASTTTITSFTPSSQSAKPFAGIKSRMARFLPHTRSSSAPISITSSPLASPRNSMLETPQAKKAVRFHTEEPVDGT